MRLLIIADDDHLSVAVNIAQSLLSDEPGSSITITDEANAGELVDSNGYDHIVRNPDMQTVLNLIKRGVKCS